MDVKEIGSLSNYDDNHNDDFKKTIGLINDKNNSSARASRFLVHFFDVHCTTTNLTLYRGGEWYPEKRGSRKILAGSRNLGSVFDKSRSLVFAWFVFTFFESRNFLPKSLGLGFLTRISASRRVSDFTIRHPSLWRTWTYDDEFPFIFLSRNKN